MGHRKALSIMLSARGRYVYFKKDLLARRRYTRRSEN